MNDPHSTRFVIKTLAAMLGLGLVSAETSAPPPPAAAEPAPAATPSPPQAPPKLSVLLGYQPRTSRDPGGPARNVSAVTRAGGQPDLKLVALSPGNHATTVLPKPVLWWHQSHPTQHRELQFTLTNLSGSRPETVFTTPLPAKQAGFQSVDLANLAVNPRMLTLSPDLTYQWTVTLNGPTSKSAVYTRLLRLNDPALENALRDAPNAPETLEALSNAGNWHELFGRIAALTRDYPDEPSYQKIRGHLLEQAGLSKHLPESGKTKAD